MPNVVEQRAVWFVTEFLTREGFTVTNVTRNRAHRGYDIVAARPGEEVKIEVKGCTKEWEIPDPYFTEFDSERRLVADFLYVVYFIGSEPPRLCAIPREAIDPSAVTPRQGYRISGRLKKESVLGRFIKRT